ncbi:MAG: hypothetical protein Q8R90_02485 [Bacteroidales bacterium]|nr:hypothetical protein [Bacteroidales bacterium]
MDRNGHSFESVSGERGCCIWSILLIDKFRFRSVFISIPAYERSEYRFLYLERKEFVDWNGAIAEWRTTIS